MGVEMSNLQQLKKLPATLISLLILFYVSPTFAALDALPDSPHQDATIPKVAGHFDETLGIAYKTFTGFAVVVGLIFIYVGLSRLKKINNDEISGSVASCFWILGIGGAMASLGVVLFSMSKTVESGTTG
jgi:hypothetical protein